MGGVKMVCTLGNLIWTRVLSLCAPRVYFLSPLLCLEMAIVYYVSAGGKAGRISPLSLFGLKNDHFGLGACASGTCDALRAYFSPVEAFIPLFPKAESQTVYCGLASYFKAYIIRAKIQTGKSP